MTKNKLSFLILIIFTKIIFSQTGIIQYKVTKLDSPETSKPDVTKRIITEINRATFTLIYNEEKSFFEKNKILPIHPFEFKVAAVLTNSKYKWHQFNNKEKFSTYRRSIKNKSYLINHSSKMKKWELTNESKMIDGYNCYKATKEIYNEKTGNIIKITSWYTPTISVPYGPVGYGGLPGLILELNIGKSLNFLVKKIILNPKKSIKIPVLKKGKIVTVKEIVEISTNARKVTKD